jgi:DNA polymerase
MIRRGEAELAELYAYCKQDVAVETALDKALPPLSDFERRVWELDQEINVRGIPVDVDAIHAACELLRQAERVLCAEINALTGGAVDSPTKRDALLKWILSQGVAMDGLTADEVDEQLDSNPPPPPQVRRALEIRKALSSTSTKKVWAFANRVTAAGRIHGSLVYGGADRTLRWAGRGIQPHNFPRPDAPVRLDASGRYGLKGVKAKWNEDTTDQFIAHLIEVGGDYVALSTRWGDPLKALSAALRGFICAPAGSVLVGSDYTAIEAVVLAVLAGEEWRVDVFNGHGKIYETSAAKITGRTLEDYAAYKKEHGDHHPDRALGKLAELASGYGGGVGAWVKFGADKFFTAERCEEYRGEWVGYSDWCASKGRKLPTLQEFAIQKQVWTWRKASPKVVELWAGLEDAAISAVRNPGTRYDYRLIHYVVEGGVLYCGLPSGRRLAYHQPRIGRGKFGPAVRYHANNTNAKFGKMGWVELDTYGGKLTENVVQAVARDILAHGLLNVKGAGLETILHIHDEIINEGDGSVAELEALMGDLPVWASGWPVRAADGWKGRRFRK